jgi:hypothetical protein
LSRSLNTIANGGYHMATHQSAPSKLTWWQWALMYPTLIVAVITALPTVYQAVQATILSVPFGNVYDATEQSRLWEKNYRCLQGRTFEKITTDHNISVSAIACPSGDVCVSVSSPSERERIRWIELKSFLAVNPDSSLFAAVALAAGGAAEHGTRVAQSGRSILCQKWLQDGRLLMRVKTSDGQCFDETVDTYRGVVIKRVPAPCTPNC